MSVGNWLNVCLCACVCVFIYFGCVVLSLLFCLQHHHHHRRRLRHLLLWSSVNISLFIIFVLYWLCVQYNIFWLKFKLPLCASYLHRVCVWVSECLCIDTIPQAFLHFYSNNSYSQIIFSEDFIISFDGCCVWTVAFSINFISAQVEILCHSHALTHTHTLNASKFGWVLLWLFTNAFATLVFWISSPQVQSSPMYVAYAYIIRQTYTKNYFCFSQLRRVTYSYIYIHSLQH